MTTHALRPSLRVTLALDGVACLVMGVGLASLASPLEGLTDLSSAFLRGAGLLLLPVGAFILAIASRREIPGWGVAFIVTGNAAWIAASLALPLIGLIEPNALGLTLVLGQAAVVAVLTGLEHAQRPLGGDQVLQA